MNIYWILAVIGWTISCFSAGIYAEHEHGLAKQVGIADAQTKRIADGQTKIIEFNQEWDKTNANSTPCTLTLHQRKLLK